MPKAAKSSYKCNVCTKLFTLKHVYRKHISICSIADVKNKQEAAKQSKQLNCQNCGKIFIRSGWLERHYKTSPNCLSNKTCTDEIDEDSCNYNFSNN